MKKLDYSKSVNYNLMDPIKILAQQKAKGTANLLKQSGMKEVSASRGESAYVWETPDAYFAFVIEGLGTKNLVADELRRNGKTYYDKIAQDTVATIVNDIIVVGAKPIVINAYFAVGDSTWFKDLQRSKDLINGWSKACAMAGATWGGGETPTLQNIVHPKTIELGGSCIGIIKPKKRLVLGNKLKAGDRVLLLQSSGIHANGLTLARKIADKLPRRYSTKINGQLTYGEALLKPTIIYAKLVRDLFKGGVDLHYIVNITGHGWRKLMRATKPFTYILDKLPKPQPIFDFIQKHSGNSDKEMYGNFNMGAGFAVFVPQKDVEKVLRIAKKHKIKAYNAGYVERGPKKVIIKPKNITFEGTSLRVR